MLPEWEALYLLLPVFFFFLIRIMATTLAIVKKVIAPTPPKITGVSEISVVGELTDALRVLRISPKRVDVRKRTVFTSW